MESHRCLGGPECVLSQEGSQEGTALRVRKQIDANSFSLPNCEMRIDAPSPTCSPSMCFTNRVDLSSTFDHIRAADTSSMELAWVGREEIQRALSPDFRATWNPVPKPSVP